MVRAPAPTPVSDGPAPAATPTVGDKSADLYGSALDALLAGVKDDQPLPGTAAAIQQNRQALATYAKSAEARAGMQAAKNGSFGQGTANQMANAVRGDILGELANSELENTKLVSAEKQGLLDKAIQAGQFGLNQDARRQEFTATMAQRKDEFTQTFGAQQGQDYVNRLERMSLDNPVLASKLTDYLLSGKTGPLGSFTAQEKAEIQKYVAENKGRQDKLTEVMNTIIGSIPGQITASNQADADAAAKIKAGEALEAAKKEFNSLPKEQFLAPDKFKLLEENQVIPRYSIATLPSTPEGVVDLLRTYPSGTVSLDGEQYKVVKGGVHVKESGNALISSRKDYPYVQVIDAAGQVKFIYNGEIHDKLP